jgi:hypothetical protein
MGEVVLQICRGLVSRVLLRLRCGGRIPTSHFTCEGDDLFGAIQRVALQLGRLMDTDTKVEKARRGFVKRTLV